VLSTVEVAINLSRNYHVLFVINRIQPSLYRCRSIFKLELKVAEVRINMKERRPFGAWVDSFI
jgi:hypothetical protein